MIVATSSAIILVFFIDDMWLADTFGSVYPLPPDYKAYGVKALSGTVFPIKLFISIIATTISWIVTTYLTRPEDKKTLREFYQLTHPGGPGWRKVVNEAEEEGHMINERYKDQSWEMPVQILMVFIGCIIIYSSLFAIGNILYGNPFIATILFVVAIAGTYFLFKSFNKLRAN
jgi:hypothetical protein